LNVLNPGAIILKRHTLPWHNFLAPGERVCIRARKNEGGVFFGKPRFNAEFSLNAYFRDRRVVLTDNIIETLVQIDERARSITDNAEKERIKLAEKMETDMRKIRASIEHDSNAKIKKLHDLSREETKRKKDDIESSTREKIAGMRKFFEENHKKWENEIFNHIIGR
jgi:hypothetical protein